MKIHLLVDEGRSLRSIGEINVSPNMEEVCAGCETKGQLAALTERAIELKMANNLREGEIDDLNKQNAEMRIALSNYEVNPLHDRLETECAAHRQTKAELEEVKEKLRLAVGSYEGLLERYDSMCKRKNEVIDKLERLLADKKFYLARVGDDFSRQSGQFCMDLHGLLLSVKDNPPWTWGDLADRATMRFQEWLDVWVRNLKEGTDEPK